MPRFNSVFRCISFRTRKSRIFKYAEPLDLFTCCRKKSGQNIESKLNTENNEEINQSFLPTLNRLFPYRMWSMGRKWGLAAAHSQTCVFLGMSLAETGSLGHAVQLSLPCRLDRFINALLCEGSVVANRDTSFT